MPATMPSEVRLSADKTALTLIYPQGSHNLAASHLRRNSPSAEVKGHFGQGGKVPTIAPGLHITGLEPVGTYALRIQFSDGHQTGLFTWDLLTELASTPQSA